MSWKASFRMEELDEFETFSEAFKAIYDEINQIISKSEPLMVMDLEATTWIVKSESGSTPILFNDARDIMCETGYIIDGKFIDKR